MSGQSLLIVLRVVHIVLGVFWAGSAAMLGWFIMPSLRAAGAGGPPFVQELMDVRKLSMWLAIASGLAILSGLAMYARFAMYSQGSFASSRPGMIYGIGAVTAIIAAILGGGVSGRAGRRIAALASLGPPSESVRAEIAELNARAMRATQWAAALLVITALAMAVARYV